MTDRLDWSLLLCQDRLEKDASAPRREEPAPGWLFPSRLEGERDYDRILYAASTRRLGDKTQVFPLDRTDTVRNRLTHSHEVSSLARSIGTHLVHSPLCERMLRDSSRHGTDEGRAFVRRIVPAVLAAAGLAHDTGNPPYGHEGEATMRSWLAMPGRLEGLGDPRDQLASDFLSFDGNAQAIRALTRLQVVKDDRGLNLTFSTLATILKYTVASHQRDKGSAAREKHGFFASESDLVGKFRSSCGLTGATRHPLTHIVEACDDIAYLVADAEDAIKKKVSSFADLLAWLGHEGVAKGGRGEGPDETIDWLVAMGRQDMATARDAGIPPSEINDVAMQIFRAKAITAMVSATILRFEEDYEASMTGELDESLLKRGSTATLARRLREFDKAHAYKDRRVLELELQGHNVMVETMDMLWEGITARADPGDPASARTTPFARYAYGRISENHRRVFERAGRDEAQGGSPLPMRYSELQLLCDMMAGMTDRFALDLHGDLKAFGGASAAGGGSGRAH